MSLQSILINNFFYLTAGLMKICRIHKLLMSSYVAVCPICAETNSAVDKKIGKWTPVNELPEYIKEKLPDHVKADLTALVAGSNVDSSAGEKTSDSFIKANYRPPIGLVVELPDDEEFDRTGGSPDREGGGASKNYDALGYNPSIMSEVPLNTKPTDAPNPSGSSGNKPTRVIPDELRRFLE